MSQCQLSKRGSCKVSQGQSLELPPLPFHELPRVRASHKAKSRYRKVGKQAPVFYEKNCKVKYAETRGVGHLCKEPTTPGKAKRLPTARNIVNGFEGKVRVFQTAMSKAPSVGPCVTCLTGLLLEVGGMLCLGEVGRVPGRAQVKPSPLMSPLSASTSSSPLSPQMARPIQVKPADSESRGGSCHLSVATRLGGGRRMGEGEDP